MTLAGLDGETIFPLTTSGELCIKSLWFNVEGATPNLSGIMTLGFNTFARIVASVLLFPPPTLQIASFGYLCL